MSARAASPVTQIPLLGTRGQWHVGAKLHISLRWSRRPNNYQKQPGSDFSCVVNDGRLLAMRHSSGLLVTCTTGRLVCMAVEGQVRLFTQDFFSLLLQQVLQAWLLQEREDVGTAP